MSQEHPASPAVHAVSQVFSILVASAWLPFQPMHPIQLLTQNLLYDLSQTAVPFDRVDASKRARQESWRAGHLPPTTCRRQLMQAAAAALGYSSVLPTAGCRLPGGAAHLVCRRAGHFHAGHRACVFHLRHNHLLPALVRGQPGCRGLC